MEPIDGQAFGVKFKAILERAAAQPDQPDVWVVYVGGHEIGSCPAAGLDETQARDRICRIVAEWARAEGANPSLGGEE